MRRRTLLLLKIFAVALVMGFPNHGAWANPYAHVNRCDLSLSSSPRLTTQMLRHFRGGPDFSERISGTYLTKDGQVHFLARDGVHDAIFSPLVNSASHYEILAQQMGEERLNRAMNSWVRGKGLSHEIRQEVRRVEAHDNLLDAEEILQEVGAYSASDPLSEELEDKVMTWLTQTERLATPLVDWLKPKVLAQCLTQQPRQLFEDPVANLVRPGLYVYRAIQVTVLLNGPKKFILSAGKSGLADSVHEMVLQALLLVIPKARVLEKTSGYIVVAQDSVDNPNVGLVKFVTKGPVKQTLVSEVFSFSAAGTLLP